MCATPPLLHTLEGRQRLVASFLNFTDGTALAPESYERSLLDRFAQGELTIDQVVAELEA